MKLGPRIAIVITLLMAGLFTVTATVLLSIRRLDLERDLDRQATELANALAAGLEPLLENTAAAAMQSRVDWARLRQGSFRLEILEPDQRPLENWNALVDAAEEIDAPAGRLFAPVDKYAMAIPLHNQLPGHPQRHIVAYMGLTRDTGYIDQAVMQTAWRLLPLLLVGVLAFGVVVYLLLKSGVVTPLRRLIDAIDAVSKGDLSRGVLPEKDDEIGSLAGRFNAMTNYLREARAEEAQANTARLAMETRLRHSEKLATMGQMAAEIAHEVGTPLNVIGGRARSLARRSQDPADVQKNARIIGVQVERITKIIRQVLDFSRKSRPTLSQVDVRQVVAESLEFIDEICKRQRIETAIDAPDDLPSIPGDPGEIQQVCLNLLMNSVHAMPSGGRLIIRLTRLDRRKEGLALAPPLSYLCMEVEDTGTGIPQADRERVFEAFFTTKDTGEGTGLGLAVAKGIVKDHDGWIEVDDHPQRGAVFRVYLPINSEAPAETPTGVERLADAPGFGKHGASSS